jgi:N-acetyl-anhydromuramyl-L-alanine amidase AmpD
VEQKGAMLALLRELRKVFPTALIVGHHDLNPQKACPCFNVYKEYHSI